jgi:hypothetical protein
VDLGGAHLFCGHLHDHRHSGEHFGPPGRRTLRYPREYLGLPEKPKQEVEKDMERPAAEAVTAAS